MTYISSQISVYIKVHLDSGGSHKVYTEKRWRSAARTGKTRLGYSEWVGNKMTAELVEPPVVTVPAPATVPVAPPR